MDGLSFSIEELSSGGIICTLDKNQKKGDIRNIFNKLPYVESITSDDWDKFDSQEGGSTHDKLLELGVFPFKIVYSVERVECFFEDSKSQCWEDQGLFNTDSIKRLTTSGIVKK